MFNDKLRSILQVLDGAQGQKQEGFWKILTERSDVFCIPAGCLADEFRKIPFLFLP